jgi:hypothetical protein
MSPTPTVISTINLDWRTIVHVVLTNVIDLRMRIAHRGQRRALNLPVRKIDESSLE